MGQECRKKIADIEGTEHQENDFDEPVRTLQHQNPDDNRGQRYADIFVETKNLAGGGDPGKFGHDVEEINEESGNHDEESGAEAELFANKIGEALAGNHA